MTLLELQRKMLTAVLRPLTPDYGMSAETEDGQSMYDEAATFIKPNSRNTSFERLEIYNRQYWFRVMSALADDFPGLIAILGEKDFDALSVAYLQSCPSRSFTLRNIGSRLEQWLIENPQWARAHYSLALDVVRLEWAYIESFDGPQAPAIPPEDLLSLDEDPRLALQPHIRLLELEYPIQDFIIAVHRAQRTSGDASNAVTRKVDETQAPSHTDLLPSKTYLAVHRYENSVYYKSLEFEFFRLLSAFQRNASLSEALEEAFVDSSIPDAERAESVQQWFAISAELGWFCKPSVKN